MPRPRKYKTNADRSRAYRDRKKDKEQALRVELDRLSADKGGRPGERPKTGWDYRRVTTSPGEMLVEEFLKPLGISEKRLALRTLIPVSRINAIIHGRRAITAETALRFARFFGNSPEFWLNVQMMHDLTKAKLAQYPNLASPLDSWSGAWCWTDHLRTTS